jgi:hypothetical protein
MGQLPTYIDIIFMRMKFGQVGLLFQNKCLGFLKTLR